MGIALLIVGLLVLAVVAVLVTAPPALDHRTPQPGDAQERPLDRARGSSRPKETSRSRRRPTKPAPAPTRPDAPSSRARPIGEELEPSAAKTPVMYEPVDEDELGVTRRQFFNRSILAGSGIGLGRVRGGVTRLPLAVGRRRFPSEGQRGIRGRRQDRVRQQDPVLQRQRQDLHRRLPQGRPPEGQEGLQPV